MRDPNHQKVLNQYRINGIVVCVLCFHEASSVHEIEPRSTNPSHWQELVNRVPLCAFHHELIHQEGAVSWAGRLRQAQSTFLNMLSNPPNP